MANDLLPEGEHAFTVKRCETDTLSDGSEVLFLELECLDKDGNPHVVHEVIKDQARLDAFLVSIGYEAGAMKLKGKQ